MVVSDKNSLDLMRSLSQILRDIRSWSFLTYSSILRSNFILQLKDPCVSRPYESCLAPEVRVRLLLGDVWQRRQAAGHVDVDGVFDVGHRHVCGFPDDDSDLELRHWPGGDVPD